ncbi:uncharacterized protein [Triticum aestivum]|uniref:uncharacterized protein n=1 Tax=Triticum aestivum TaxID=4565 RepID=UPI001D01E547|nr:uncharacterized protein LOC123142753 [Triticum aestivum]
MYTTKRCIATAIVVVLWLQATADARRLSPGGVIRLSSDGRGDSVDQVGSSKVISIEDPFYTCPDGKVLKCKVIAFQWYCDCVREKGVGPTDQAMSATTSSPRKAGEQMLSRRNSGDKGASVNETYATIVIVRKNILNWNI